MSFRVSRYDVLVHISVFISNAYISEYQSEQTNVESIFSSQDGLGRNDI